MHNCLRKCQSESHHQNEHSPVQTIVYHNENRFCLETISENCFKTNAIYKTHLKDNQMHKAFLKLLVLRLQEAKPKCKLQIFCWEYTNYINKQ